MGRGGKRLGAGRPIGTTKAEGMSTKVIRISSEISKEQCEAIPLLIDVLNHWEDKCATEHDNPRYYHLKRMLDEIRTLGF